jgi:cytochrome c oxidase assembly protein subunit 11
MIDASANRALLKKLLVVALGMFGFGYALAPFYSKLCEVAGLNQIQYADAAPANTQIEASRTITLELDANVRDDLPWTFRPVQKSVKVHPGELVQVMYEIKNSSGQAAFGQAIPSYGPRLAGQYVKKLECFCFTRQEVKAGETRQLPVVFVIERGLPEDVKTVTLSYTFFRVEGAGPKPG